MIDLQAPVDLKDVRQAIFLQKKAAAEASLRAFVEHGLGRARAQHQVHPRSSTSMRCASTCRR